ncbi:MAG TPA: hypothetical protein PLI62_11760, partial [Spirochaetota bacterium]|nr:hypothetical protein [Spirochaetota bacterium]
MSESTICEHERTRGFSRLVLWKKITKICHFSIPIGTTTKGTIFFRGDVDTNARCYYMYSC